MQVYNAQVVNVKGEIIVMAKRAKRKPARKPRTMGVIGLGYVGLPLARTFFDSAFTTASAIQISADVMADSRVISAGTPDGGGAYRAGANDVAETIATTRDRTIAALGTTPGGHFRGLVSNIGLAVRSSTDTADVHRTLADRAETRRLSLSGVSVDEELVQMIQFQTAYGAAARVVTTANEMLQALLAM